MLESGQTLSARFTLVRRLGAGGHGEVWLAQDRERQGFAALKILASAITADAGSLTALEHITAQVSALHHPNILRVFGLIEAGPQQAIAMEYAAGGDASVLRGRPAQESLPVLLALTDALLHAHAAGVIHGDLKPGNVLIGSDDLPRITDFTAAGEGSPYNLSPQRLQGAALTPADDVYALGVLAYELLSGYPPFYPQPTPERVIHEVAPMLVPRYPVPERLVTLVMSCLAKDAEHRPVMAEVRTELAAALAELRQGGANTANTGAAPTIAPPSDETLRGHWQRSTAVIPEKGGSARWRTGVIAAALVILVTGALGAFVILPQWSQQQNAATFRPAQSPVAAEPERQEQQPVDFALLAQQKQQAEDLRAALDPRWQALTERAVEQWASEAATAVKARIKEGDDLLAGREYADALQRFQSAETEITRLEQELPRVLTATMDNGAQAITRGDSVTAKKAYELAVAMDKDSAAAKAGLKRAESLDQVLALLATARSQEQAGQISAALASYKQALSLDPQTQAASTAVARIEAQLSNDAFGRAMARGYDALTRNNYVGARDAFAEARKIRGGAAEVDQALAQLQQQERTQTIAGHLQRAGELEAQERWGAALDQLQAALKLDANVAAAVSGVARVEPRARLHDEFELYLSQPERLFAPAVRQTAQASLQRARAIPEQGPVLRSQIEKLATWLERASQPVRVSLQSDNQTNVTIYRVGELGTFTERSLELAPGKYTIVGTRPGYRDVRREVALTPGQASAPVVIRCEDPV